MSKMYNQVREVEIAYESTSTTSGTTTTTNSNAITLTYDSLDINFTVQFQSSSDSNVCTLSVYNLAPATIAKITTGDPIRIKAGYEEFNGYIFTGKVDYVKTTREGGDSLTKITCTPDVTSWNITYISKSWNKGITASEVTKQIISLAGWEIGSIDIEDDVTYQGGKMFRNNARYCLEEIAKDTNSTLYFNNRLVYMYAKDKEFKKTITVSPSNGLLDYPTTEVNKTTNITSYKIKTALRYDYQEDTIIKVEDSDYIDAVNLKIIDGTHHATDSEFYTELLCQKVEEITTNKDSDYITA